MNIQVYDYMGNGKKKVSNFDSMGSEFFLKTNTGYHKKDYRISVDKDGDLVITLINGQDIRIVSQSGYPSVKIIGRSCD